MNLAPIKKLNPEKLDGFLNINNIQKSVEDRYNYSSATDENTEIYRGQIMCPSFMELETKLRPEID